MNTKSLILERIKKHKNFKSNVEFAAFLGISPQLVSKWITRNTFDIDILYAKLPELSPDWLLTGKGSMLKSKATIGLMNEAEIAAQDAEVAAGTVQVGAEPPPAVANHPSYRRLLEAVQEQAAEVSKLQKDLIAAYKELNELRKKG